MPTIQETAYPRLKAHVSAHDLAAIYTPTPDELALAGQSARGEGARLGFLILLKTFQRLGYFVPVGQVPASLAEHIAASAQTQAGLSDLAGYDLSGTRRRHLQIIRQTLHVHPGLRQGSAPCHDLGHGRGGQDEGGSGRPHQRRHRRIGAEKV